jgi:hypothetical protein
MKVKFRLIYETLIEQKKKKTIEVSVLITHGSYKINHSILEKERERERGTVSFPLLKTGEFKEPFGTERNQNQ